MSSAGAVSTVMAFDYGKRRIGVAVGSTLIGTANPLTTLHHTGDPDWTAIDKLVREWGPDLLLVGLPLMLDDSPSANTVDAERFGANLQEHTGRKVIMVDEKLSSAAARDEIRARRQAGMAKRTQPGDIDKFAAQVILRTWLNQRGGRQPENGDG
ncbi:MAG: Holliday junction resolvase RuvX [Pseudomonadota bacterium]